MTNKKSTKRALLSSILAMVLCCSMLIGTTFAWFTDSVTSKGNIIKTGTLNVEMYWSEGKDAPTDDAWKDASKGAIFNNTLWEPGYTEARHLKIANEGSLALKYQLAIIPNGDVSELADVIDVYYQSPAKQISADRQNLGTKVGTLADVIRTGIHDGALAAETAYTATIVLKMQESAGNKYQDKSIGTSFSIQLIATQMASENDSFGPDYDADAWHPAMTVSTVSELKSAVANITDGTIIRLTNDIVMNAADATNDNAIYYTGDKSFTIDLNGFTLTTNTNNAGIRVQKAAGAENTITIKNGSIVAGDNCWSAISVGSSAETKTFVNLSNLKVSSSKANDMAIRSRTGAEFTITDCEVVATNGAGGIVAGGGNVTLNNVTVKQSGYYANNWNSVALGISGSGVMTVNSGSYTSDPEGNANGTWVAYIMSSGGTLEINGGTFNGTTGNAARGLICADKAAIVEINGGTFTSTGAILHMCNNVGTLPNPKATIAGGNFSADPTVCGFGQSGLISVASGYTNIKNVDGTYTVLKGDVAVSNSDALVDAINAGKKNIVLASGDYALRFTNNTSFNLNGVTLVGFGDAKLSISSSEAWYGRVQASDVTFENVHFTSTVGATGKATYNNCTFDSWTICASSNNEETYLNSCTINGCLNTSTDFSSGDVFVKDSTIVKAEYSGSMTMNFENCEIGELIIWGGNTVLNGCTYTTIANMGSGSVLVDGVNLVTNNAQLTAVIASGATKVLLADGDYDLNGNQKNGLTLIGVGENVNMANTTKYAGGKAVGAITKSVTLQNMTITNTVYTMEDGGNATFDKVYFAAGFRQGYGKNVTFNECTFGSNSEGYALHFQTDSASEGGNITLNGCTFEGGKVHLGGKRAYTFENCEFAAGTDFQVWSTITLNGCTVDGVAVTDANIATLFPKLDLTKVTIQ